jgi:hypothetical protein
LSGFDPRYMVKQFLCSLTNKKDGRCFNVYESGLKGWVLLRPVVNGCELVGFDSVVERSNLVVKVPRP